MGYYFVNGLMLKKWFRFYLMGSSCNPSILVILTKHRPDNVHLSDNRLLGEVIIVDSSI